MARKALLVGINTYAIGANLNGCVADADALATALGRHKDGKINFECRTLLDKAKDGSPITRAKLRAACRELFFDCKGDSLFYFSGHGILTDAGGYLCTADASEDDWGVPMQEVVEMAIKSPSPDILMILDCCHAGNFANPKLLNQQSSGNPLAVLREGMTVIAASRDTQTAVEAGGHGLFTSAILDALEGGAADHMGWVSAPSIYSYVNRRFSSWDQRPVYKANAVDVAVVRECEPLIDRLKLQQMVVLFPSAEHKYKLDPEYEPEDEHGNVKQPVNQTKVETAHLLKEYRDAGLVRSSNAKEQFFWTARRGNTVELTPRGKEYWWLVSNEKI